MQRHDVCKVGSLYAGVVQLKPARIVIVDDEASIRDVLSDALSQQGHDVVCAANGQEMAAVGAVDLAVIDLRLDNEDGLQLAREVRETSNIPIMMLTGKGDETDKIVGLEVAADDYMLKPFNLREFTARITALLRRSFAPRALSAATEPVTTEETVYRFSSWTLNATRRQLTHEDGHQPVLTHGEFTLLEALVSAPHRVLSREQLIVQTHGYNCDSLDRTIDVLILRLRRKIEPNPRVPSLIKTERGIGYVFAHDVLRSSGVNQDAFA